LFSTNALPIPLCSVVALLLLKDDCLLYPFEAILANEKVVGGLLVTTFGVGPREEFERGDDVCSTDEPNVPPSESDPVLDKRPVDSAKDTRGDGGNPLVSRELDKENDALMLW
jgi:hypothetical protein